MCVNYNDIVDTLFIIETKNRKLDIEPVRTNNANHINPSYMQKFYCLCFVSTCSRSYQRFVMQARTEVSILPSIDSLALFVCLCTK